MNNPLHGSASCFTVKKKKGGFHHVVRKANVAKMTAEVRKKYRIDGFRFISET